MNNYERRNRGPPLSRCIHQIRSLSISSFSTFAYFKIFCRFHEEKKWMAVSGLDNAFSTGFPPAKILFCVGFMHLFFQFYIHIRLIAGGKSHWKMRMNEASIMLFPTQRMQMLDHLYNEPLPSLPSSLHHHLVQPKNGRNGSIVPHSHVL